METGLTLREIIKAGEEVGLFPYIFRLSDSMAFSIAELLKPYNGLGNLFHGTCFITSLGILPSGGVYWRDGHISCRLDKNTILKCDGGKMETAGEGLGGVYLALVTRRCGFGECKKDLHMEMDCWTGRSRRKP